MFITFVSEAAAFFRKGSLDKGRTGHKTQASLLPCFQPMNMTWHSPASPNYIPVMCGGIASVKFGYFDSDRLRLANSDIFEGDIYGEATQRAPGSSHRNRPHNRGER